MTDNLSIGIFGRACLSDWQCYDAHVCDGLSEHANHTAITPPYFGSIWCHRQTLLKVKPIILTTWRWNQRILPVILTRLMGIYPSRCVKLDTDIVSQMNILSLALGSFFEIVNEIKLIVQIDKNSAHAGSFPIPLWCHVVFLGFFLFWQRMILVLSVSLFSDYCSSQDNVIVEFHTTLDKYPSSSLL